MLCRTVIVLALVLLSQDARAQYGLVSPFNHTFSLPTDIQNAGDDRVFVVEKFGKVWVLQNDIKTEFLDVSDDLYTPSESGLHSIAFPPDHDSTGYFYICRTTAERYETVSRFSVMPGNPNVADRNSEVEVISERQGNQIHNGGQIAFGPDGYLYFSLGDDGFGANSQDIDDIKGTIMRIDVSTLPYTIPPDNPLVDKPGKDEIWAWGFRNPWRFSFDKKTGKLWCADVGEDTWEEINIVEPGQNYGWPLLEGFQCYEPPECDTVGIELTMPVHVYDHGTGLAIIGGHVYRGSDLPELSGRYIFGDFDSGTIWALQYGGQSPHIEQLNPDAGGILCFGTTTYGELMFGTLSGDLFCLTRNPTSATPPEETGRSGRIESVFPNPFNPSTTIRFVVDHPGRTRLTIYTVNGERVRDVVDGFLGDGQHDASWDGRRDDGTSVPSGVYFVALTVGDRVISRYRLVLLK